MCKFFKYTEKHLALVLIIMVLAPSFLYLTVPKEAGAILAVPVAEVAANLFTNLSNTYFTIEDWVVTWIINPLVDAIAAALIWQMFEVINNWIINGFDGNPLFVTDWEGFLRRVGNDAFGFYVDDLIARGAPDICSPFRLNVLLGLISVSRPFPRCTLDAFVSNVADIFNDFGNYGWAGFFSVTMFPSNNAFGSLLIQMDAAQRAILEKASGLKQEASASTGFLSWKECVEFNSAGDCVLYTTNTPGSYARDKLNIPDNYTATRLAVAKGVDGLISALAQQLVQMAFTAIGPGGLANASIPPEPIYVPPPLGPLDPLDPQRQRIIDTMNDVITNENRYISARRAAVTALREIITTLQSIMRCSTQDRQSEIVNARNRIASAESDIAASEARIAVADGLIDDARTASSAEELESVTMRMSAVRSSSISLSDISDAERENADLNDELSSLRTELTAVNNANLAAGITCTAGGAGFINASRTTISAGESSTISWSPPAGSVSCTAFDAWTGPRNPAGGSQVVSPSTTSTYYLRCEDAGSNFTYGSVTITVIP